MNTEKNMKVEIYKVTKKKSIIGSYILYCNKTNTKSKFNKLSSVNMLSKTIIWW